MRLIDADALDKFLDVAEKEATKNRKYVLASAINTIRGNIRDFPSAEPSVSDCWGCNCPKMERLKKQKTFSEMVRLHDAETHCGAYMKGGEDDNIVR